MRRDTRHASVEVGGPAMSNGRLNNGQHKLLDQLKQLRLIRLNKSARPDLKAKAMKYDCRPPHQREATVLVQIGVA